MLQTGELVIGDTCQNVMRAIESRVHDKKEPLKVEKVVGDPYDDVWDALRYALYSHHDPEKKPLDMRVQDRLAAIREKAGTPNSDSARDARRTSVPEDYAGAVAWVRCGNVHTPLVGISGRGLTSKQSLER